MEVRQRVREVVVEDGWALVKVIQVPDRPGVAAALFEKIAEAGLSVDLILQNASVERSTDMSFTVRQGDVAKAKACVGAVQDTIQAKAVEAQENLAKVQIVGTGILTDPTYVGRMFRALADARVNVLAIGTSEIKITCLIHAEDQRKARRALDAAFQAGVDA
jgi:aspartate kinase